MSPLIQISIYVFHSMYLNQAEKQILEPGLKIKFEPESVPKFLFKKLSRT